MSDDKIINFRERLADNDVRRPPKPTDLATKKIRDLSVKAVIYPQTVNAREIQELGAAVLHHLKLFYPSIDQ